MNSIGYEFEASDDNTLPAVPTMAVDESDVVPLDENPRDAEVDEGYGVEFGHMLALGVTDDEKKSIVNTMDRHAIVEQFKSQIDENASLKNKIQSCLATNKKLANAVAAARQHAIERADQTARLKERFSGILAQKNSELESLRADNNKLAERCKDLEARGTKELALKAEGLGFLFGKLKEKVSAQNQLAGVVREQNVRMAALATELRNQRIESANRENQYKARIEQIMARAQALREKAKAIISDRTQRCARAEQELLAERAASQNAAAQYGAAYDAAQSDNERLASENTALRAQISRTNAQNGRVVAALVSKLAAVREQSAATISKLMSASAVAQTDVSAVGELRRDLERSSKENDDLRTRLMRFEIAEGKNEFTFDYDNI